MISAASARRRISVAALTAVACAAGAGPAFAAPPATAADGNASAAPGVTPAAWEAGRARYGADATAAQAVAAFWTEERMRAAVPVEKSPAFQRALEGHEARKAADRAKARSMADRGQRPEPAGPEFRFAPREGAVSKGTPASATARASAFDPGLAPGHPTALTNGKVFFTVNGSLGQCSASVVNTEGRDAVWTAGHCAHTGRGGQWVTDWQFVPSYDDDLANPRPYGTWHASFLSTRTKWMNESDFAEDMAVATMQTSGGWHVADYLGGNGFRANAGKRVYQRAFGYPAESPFDGGNLFGCEGTSSPESSFLFWSSETIKIPCDMTRGSSGGAYLHGYDGNLGWLNGVVSRIDRIVGPTISLSPYFDDTALSLFNHTRYN